MYELMTLLGLGAFLGASPTTTPLEGLEEEQNRHEPALLLSPHSRAPDATCSILWSAGVVRS